MQILSRRKFVNILAGGLAGAGLGYAGIRYGLPEIRGRIGDKPNIVLISIDTLRQDFFTSEFMPKTFQWVEANCLNFTNAHANATWTLPSHLTMLTGLLPREHGVELAVDLIPESVRMAQQELQPLGYDTVAFTGGGFVGEFFGFSRGFRSWYETPKGTVCPFPIARQYLLSLRRVSRPAFLFLHTFYVHNYSGDKKNYEIGAYGSKIMEFDSIMLNMITDLLRSPLSRNLKMIITSDHGEGFGETYSYYERKYVSEQHGDWPCPSQERIPMAVYDAQTPAGSSTDLVGLDNIYPTICKWVNMGGEAQETLLSRQKRSELLSETIPLLGTKRCIEKGQDIKKRGNALIQADGKYQKTWLDGGNEAPSIDRELPQDVKEHLKGLGYL